MELNRRSFVKAAGAAFVGGVGLAKVDGPQASLGVPETWDVEADVVVIGTGTITPAALRAHEGASMLSCLRLRRNGSAARRRCAAAV